MNSRSTSQLRKTSSIIASLLLLSGLASPALASQTGPAVTPGSTTSSTPAPSAEASQNGESEKKPNVGDDAPAGFNVEKQENFLTDESGLIALGLAVLVGAGTAFLVMRMRRKTSLY